MNLNPKPLEGPKIPQDSRVDQPMNLAPVKVTSSMAIPAASGQPIALHGHHVEQPTSKSAFTTLRLPTPPRPVVGSASIISGNVPSSRILSATKPSPRQLVTTTVYPVMSLGGSGTPVPMASIIRGTLPQTISAHSTGTALYSSHIPRGAAAVASISAGPKSAVATPILRPTHPSALQQMTVRAPALNMNRAGIQAPIQKSATAPSLNVGQVIDIPKAATGGQAIQIGRPIDASAIRSAKPVHISQPVVQQMSDKGYFKATTATVISAAGSPLPTVLRQPRTCASVATIAPALNSTLRPVVTTATHVSPALVPTSVGLKTSVASSVAVVATKPPDLSLAAKKGVVVPNSTVATGTTPATIPVAKVHPQPSVVGPRPSVFEAADGARGIYIAHPSPANAAVVLSENRSDGGGPVRFTSLSRPYAVPQAAYFYESYQVQNAIPVHPYSAGNSNSLRTAQHANTTTQSVPATNPVVVTVDSTPTLHPVFTTAVSDVAPPTVYTSSASLAPPGAYSPASHTNHSTSPRPSILRKRASDGVNVAKKNLLASLPGSGPASPHPEAPKPPPRSEVPKENGCPSVEPVEAASPQPAGAAAVTVKAEPPETATENGSANGLPPSVVAMETSPRKKPRKQQLAATELLESHSTDGEDGYDLKKVCKRPSMSLLNSYRHTWKSRHNHFQRYTDVKPKDDKKCTVNELANQKGVIQKTNGWKIYHLTTQLDDVADLESAVHGRLSGLLEFVEKSVPWKKPLPCEEEKILVKVSDLIKGNLQRSKIAQDQVTEMKQQVMRMLEHKPQIVEIIGKYVSKRPIKKKN